MTASKVSKPVEPTQLQLSFAQRAVVKFFKFVNKLVSWHKLPTLMGTFNLLAFRYELRAENLYDTYASVDVQGTPATCPMKDKRFLTARNSDGYFNDLDKPKMGCAAMRFGRNIPRDLAKKPTQEELMTPNPRVVSETFMKRTLEEFKPATTLNLLAAAWIQFQVHDWAFHPQQYDNKYEIDLAKGDTWPAKVNGKMTVPASQPDEVQNATDRISPAYKNSNTPWWDGSQIYGDNEELTRSLRTKHPDGMLELDDNNLEQFLPRDGKGLVRTGFRENWWLGLELLHTLFAKEHNSICKMLRDKHPDWTGDQIFDKARLVNSALMAKIHTIEWTPGILAHPALQLGMSANWWGLAGETLTKNLGRISSSEVISGLPGSGVDHDCVPYSLTEEFVSVYRLHALIPDNIAFFDAKTGKHEQTTPIEDVAFEKSRDVIKDDLTFEDAFYSFGINYPGAITHNNYSLFMRGPLDTGDNVKRDMGTIDVLRDRERGIPRYCEMRRQLHMTVPKTFVELTGGDKDLAKKLEDLYVDVEKVDMIVGCQCEPLPKGFGFSDTAFRVFILMATRRLKSDRFIAGQWNAETYTAEGLHWVQHNTMISVLIRQFPNLEPILKNQKNAFAPWTKLPATKEYKGRETNASA